VWIAIHENQRLPLPSLNENETKMAKNQAPPPIPSGAIREPQSSASAKPAVILSRPQTRDDEKAIADGRAASGVARQSPVPGGAAGGKLTDSLADKEFRERKDRERDASLDQLTAANRSDLDTKDLPEALRKKEEASAQAAKVQAPVVELQNSQIQNQNSNYASPKVPGPAPLNQMDSSAKAKRAAAAPAPTAPPPQPPAEVVGGLAANNNSSLSMEVASASNLRLISPPGSNAVWLAGRRGLIEFSKDGGSSWSRQTSGVLADLLTGSAPSEQVCWIVGRIGAVLRTTDGGAHWKVISAPLTEDLGGIRATDALHATIWNARATKSFATSDGGLTWKPLPNP
jgi:hypothetical protein